MLGRPYHIFSALAQAYVFDICLLIFLYKSLYSTTPGSSIWRHFQGMLEEGFGGVRDYLEEDVGRCLEYVWNVLEGIRGCC